MNVIQNLLSTSKYKLKSPYTMVAEVIVVHNTANDATARNEVAYMIRNDNSTSFHYAIDDKEIVQGVPDNRNAFHAGDGGNGKGNRNGLSIEICYSKSGGQKFTNAEKLSAKFIAFKLNEKGWGINKVTKHQDYSGKYCPHRTLDMGWQRFLNMIQMELDKLQTEELIDMALAKWQEDMGRDALKSLNKKKDNFGQPIVNSPDDWSKKLEQDIPGWLFWSIIDRITK